MDVDLVEPLLQVQNLLGMIHDVGRLPLEAAGRLVQHDAGIGQREALALLAGGEQERGHGGGLADAQGRHRRTDEVHGVVDRHPRGDHAARGVDVHRDLLLRSLGLQEQELRHHQGRHPVLDRTGDEDDALLEEPRIDVVGPLAADGLLDHHGDDVVHVRIAGISHLGSFGPRGPESSGGRPPCSTR